MALTEAVAQTGSGERSGDPATTWKPLRFFTLYRFVLAGLFWVLSHLGEAPPPLGSFDPRLFYWASSGYLLFAVAARLGVHFRRPGFQPQVYGQVLVDIAVLTLMMHASGGIGSGLGMLLVVAVAGGSILLHGRAAGLFAALATIALLAEQLYGQFGLGLEKSNYPQAGMLGVTLFATAALAYVLARRLRESEAVARQRGVDLANMAQLTEYIIQRMQIGVTVVDGGGGVLLSNAAAQNLLHQPIKKGDRLERVAPQLAAQLAAWREQGRLPTTLAGAEPGTELTVRFTRAGSGRRPGTLIFIEDASAVAKQARQLKLAALGRLTASIAHEIRNPLGAISHAGQLLAEAPQLTASDQRLVEIVVSHAQRINTIIDNVRNLSRRDKAVPERIALSAWLHRFVAEFEAVNGLSPGEIEVRVEPEELQAMFSASQLHQVLWNLCQNAVNHTAGDHRPRVSIEARLDVDGVSPYLEVQDKGPGIPEEVAPQVFEPFFTAGSGGSGLGLYIARELAECNQARLELLPSRDGARFRLSFAPLAQEEKETE